MYPWHMPFWSYEIKNHILYTIFMRNWIKRTKKSVYICLILDQNVVQTKLNSLICLNLSKMTKSSSLNLWTNFNASICLLDLRTISNNQTTEENCMKIKENRIETPSVLIELLSRKSPPPMIAGSRQRHHYVPDDETIIAILLASAAVAKSRSDSIYQWWTLTLIGLHEYQSTFWSDDLNSNELDRLLLNGTLLSIY